MKHQSQSLKLLAAFTLLTVGATPSGASADDSSHGHHHGGHSHGVGATPSPSPSPSPAARPSQVRARLIPAVVDGGEGQVSLQRKTKGGAEKDLRFSVEATIASATIANQTSELKLAITRGGVAFANCTLVLDDQSDDGESAEAEYKLDLRSKNGGAVRAKSGFCDLDPTTVAVETGIPAVQAGDVFTVSDGSNNTLLTGTGVQTK